MWKRTQNIEDKLLHLWNRTSTIKNECLVAKLRDKAGFVTFWLRVDQKMLGKPSSLRLHIPIMKHFV